MIWPDGTADVGLGTITDDNSLVTHNHWTKPLSTATSVRIYDASGNNPPLYDSSMPQVNAYTVGSGDTMDYTQWTFSGDVFAGQAHLALGSVSPVDLVGETVYVAVDVNDNSTASGHRVVVRQAQVTNTAYIRNTGVNRIPSSNGLISGFQINYPIPQGSSGGPTVWVSNGQSYIVGVNSGHLNGFGYVATVYP